VQDRREHLGPALDQRAAGRLQAERHVARALAAVRERAVELDRRVAGQLGAHRPHVGHDRLGPAAREDVGGAGVHAGLGPAARLEHDQAQRPADAAAQLLGQRLGQHPLLLAAAVVAELEARVALLVEAAVADPVDDVRRLGAAQQLDQPRAGRLVAGDRRQPLDRPRRERLGERPAQPEQPVLLAERHDRQQADRAADLPRLERLARVDPADELQLRARAHELARRPGPAHRLPRHALELGSDAVRRTSRRPPSPRAPRASRATSSAIGPLNTAACSAWASASTCSASGWPAPTARRTPLVNPVSRATSTSPRLCGASDSPREPRARSCTSCPCRTASISSHAIASPSLRAHCGITITLLFASMRRSSMRRLRALPASVLLSTSGRVPP
jgi:hypothetical protein